MLFNHQSKIVFFAAIQIMLLKNSLIFDFALLNFFKIKIYLFLTFAILFLKVYLFLTFAILFLKVYFFKSGYIYK
jgi:hypothetical protein